MHQTSADRVKLNVRRLKMVAEEKEDKRESFHINLTIYIIFLNKNHFSIIVFIYLKLFINYYFFNNFIFSII